MLIEQKVKKIIVTYCDILVQNPLEGIWGHAAEFGIRTSDRQYGSLRNASCCVLVLYMSFVFPVKRKIIKKIRSHFTVHNWVYGRTMSLHVSAHGAIIRRYINKPYTTELCFLYGSIYCTYHCVLTINKKMSCASLTFVNHLYTHRLSGCVFTLL
jgi:hypothetical protein